MSIELHFQNNDMSKLKIDNSDILRRDASSSLKMQLLYNETAYSAHPLYEIFTELSLRK